MYPWFVTTGAPRLRFEVTTSLSTLLPALTSLIALASRLLGACAHEPPTKPPVEVRSDDWFMMPQRFMLAHLDQWRVPLHLQTDRPVYRPGDSLWYRGWTLDPRTSAVGSSTPSLRLLSANGQVHHVSQHEDRDGAGVLWLPLSLPGGSYRLEATVGEAVVTRPITVLNYRTPRLASTIELDRKAYRPGEVVHAALVVKGETGGMIAGARVVFTWRIGHRELAQDEHTATRSAGSRARPHCPMRSVTVRSS